VCFGCFLGWLSDLEKNQNKKGTAPKFQTVQKKVKNRAGHTRKPLGGERLEEQRLWK